MLGDRDFIHKLKPFDSKAPIYRSIVILYLILSLFCLDRTEYYGRVVG